jgi:hypothetical protein
VNHRIFERILRSRPRPRACLPQRRLTPSPPITHVMARVDLAVSAARSPLHPPLGLPKNRGLSTDPITATTGWAARLQLVGAWDRAGGPQEATACRCKPLTIRPELRQDYPLNLSISISGGKETNKDSPSNGERTGNSPTWKSPSENCSL